MHNILLSALIVISFNIGQSKIKGYVYDKYTNEKLCGVRVIMNNDTTYTDFNGCFETKNIQDSTKFKFSLISYKEKDTVIITHNNLVMSNK